MNSILKLPSLKHMTLARISVLLWQCNFTFYKHLEEMAVDKNMSIVESKICELVDGFSIPNHLKPMLCTSLSHVGKELLDMVKFLICQVFVCDNMDLIKPIICGTKWTIYGKLDIRETAKVLSKSQDLTDKNRLDIACVCCIADVVCDLCESNTDILETDQKDLKGLMFNFWKDITSAPIIDITDDKKCEMCIISMTHQNQSALEYFWSLMSKDERNKLIIKLMEQDFDISELKVIIYNAVDYFDYEESSEEPKNDYSAFPASFVFFLLFQLNEQQINALLFSDYGLTPFLPLLLDYMDVESFKPTFNQILSTITRDDFHGIIYKSVLYFDRNGNWYKLKNVRKCLTDMWKNAPAELKTCPRTLKSMFLHLALCTAKDMDNLELLLTGASVENKRRVLCRCLTLLRELRDYALHWDFIEFAAKRLLKTSDEEMMIFKEHCSFFAHDICYEITRSSENQWPTIDRFLNFSFENASEVSEFKKKLASEYLASVEIATNASATFKDNVLFTMSTTKQDVIKFVCEYLASLDTPTTNENNKIFSTDDKLIIDRFSNWAELNAPDVKSHLFAKDDEENTCALSCMHFCLQKDMQSIELLFGDASVADIRRILSICFFKLVARSRCKSDWYWDWDFVECVARKFISADDEMNVFKKNCSRLAYKIINDFYLGKGENGPMLNRFNNFCFLNLHERSHAKKCCAFHYGMPCVDPISESDDGNVSNYAYFIWCGFTDEKISEFISNYLTLNIL